MSRPPGGATDDAWGHAVVVALFALLLVMRLRAARRDDARALRALTIIAARAEVSKGLVSHYFTDKDRLMETVARSTLASIRQTVADSLQLTAPVPEVIRAAIRRAASLDVTHRAELDAMRQISAGLRNTDGSPRLGLADYEETYQGQEALFRRGQAEGSLRDFDARVMAITYQGAVDAMLAYLHEHPEADAGHYADSLGDLVVAAISRPPTSS